MLAYFSVDYLPNSALVMFTRNPVIGPSTLTTLQYFSFQQEVVSQRWLPAWPLIIVPRIAGLVRHRSIGSRDRDAAPEEKPPSATLLCCGACSQPDSFGISGLYGRLISRIISAGVWISWHRVTIPWGVCGI
jgi:hypothetical protein